MGVLGPGARIVTVRHIDVSLLQSNLAYGTRRRYLSELRSFCDYVVAKPNIPGSSELTIIEKYGPIALTFTKYDLPVHAQDRPTKPRYALSPELLEEFYEFLRTEYLPNHALPHLGAQDYTAIVLQAEIGTRTSELLGIRGEKLRYRLAEGPCASHW